jgi:adenylate cyclase
MALSARGDLAAAAAEFDAALALHPSHFEALYLYARTCLAAGDHRKAVGLFERAHRTRPDDFHVLTLLGKARRAVGDAPGARDAHRLAFGLIGHHQRLDPTDARSICDGACALVELDRRDEALEWCERARVVDDPLTYYVACAYARLGERELAIDTLARVIGAGWSHADWLRHDPDWDGYRDDPRFVALLDDLVRSSATVRR